MNAIYKSSNGEWIRNGTSAQLDYMVPFTLVDLEYTGQKTN